MATSVSIKGKTQANDGVTSTINYVNPNATDAQLVSLATAFNNLTTNTVTDITRIEKNSLLNTVEKLPRNAYLTLADEQTPITTISASQIGTDPTDPLVLDIHYNDQEGHYEDISITLNGQSGGASYWYCWYGRSGTQEHTVGALFICKVTTNVAETATITIGEDEQYQAATITLTITAE